MSTTHNSQDSRFSSTKYKELKENFNKVAKRILKDKISVNPVKLQEYEVDIKESYEKLSAYVTLWFNALESQSQSVVRSDLLQVRDKLSRCFGKLNCKSTLTPNILASIGEEKTSDSDDSEYRETFEDMAPPPEITVLEFFKTAGQILHANYSGDPLALEAFINSIELLKTIAGQTHLNLLQQIIRSKLVGKALESIPDNANTVDAIIAALRAGIKPDNSKVIAGRMMALRIDKTAANDFTKQAEDLADALRRSLIVEGISQKKAQEMVIEKTVDMCRSSAKSDLVKSILASSTFNDPKEVVAKFVVEAATDLKEKQVLHFKSNNSNNKRGRGNFWNNNSRRKGNYSNNSNGSYRNFNRGYNNNRGNRGNRRGFSNDRGRGGYSNNNNRFVRYAENSDAPSQDRRGMGTFMEPENVQYNDRSSQGRPNVQYSL